MSIFYQTTFVSACGVLIFGMFYHAITTGASLPDVHVSHSTQKCIKVVNYVEGHKYTCNDLPSHYYHVWVK